MTRRVFYHTHFLETGSTIDLLSIGMVDDTGRELYAVNAEFDLRRLRHHRWLLHNVVPRLPIKDLNPDGDVPVLQWDLDHPDTIMIRHRDQISVDVLQFLVPVTRRFGAEPACELWTEFGAYHHVVLAQLFGNMTALPDGVPKCSYELRQLWQDVGQPTEPEPTNHHALEDAHRNHELWRICVQSLSTSPQLHDGRRARAILAEALNLPSSQAFTLSMSELAAMTVTRWRNTIDQAARDVPRE